MRRRAGLAVVLAGLLLGGVSPRAAAAEGGSRETQVQAPLRVSKHARSRMNERGVSMDAVERILKTAKPFPYNYKGKTETGYYDAESRVFLATADGVLITVITNASPRYVEKLKRAKK